MKKWMIAVPLTLTVAALGACAGGTGKPEAGADKEEVVQAEGTKVKAGAEKKEFQEKQEIDFDTYEKKVIENKNNGRRVSIEYPQFGYEKLDQIIEKKMESAFEEEKENLEGLWDGEREEGVTYSFTRRMKEPVITEDIISLCFEDYFFFGAAHGIFTSYSINFDLKTERVLTLDEVLAKHDTSLDVVVDAVADKLMTDEQFADYRSGYFGNYAEDVEKETEPMKGNYNGFTIQEDSITFYHQYYPLFPNAAGMVEIELKWSELEDYQKKNHDKVNNSRAYSFGDQVKPAKSLTYHDKDFGFSFAFPPSWKNHYMLQIPDSSDLFEPYQPSKVIQLSMVDEGKFIGRLVTIGVLEGVTQEEMEDYYEGSLGTEAFMAAGNDLVLVYSIPYEPPGQTYGDEYGGLGKGYLQMVQGDMDKIVESVKFE